MTDTNGKLLMIKDTGYSEVGGATSTYSKANNGDWLTLFSSRLNIEMTTKTTNYASGQLDGDTLTFNNNELSAILPTRITIEAMMPISTQADKDLVKELLKMQGTLGVKYLKGGLGLIGVLPHSFDDNGEDAIGLLIKNIVPREVVDNSVTYIALTIQAEQLR